MKKKKTLPADFEEILERGDIAEIRGITRYCVEWVLANPNPIPLDSVDYKR